MKKFTYLFILLASLLSSSTSAQTTYKQNTIPLGRAGATDPNCGVVGTVYWNTTLSSYKVCTVTGAPGTWVIFGSGAGDVTLTGSQTLTNKTIDGTLNTVTNAVANRRRVKSDNNLPANCALGELIQLQNGKNWSCVATDLWSQENTALDLLSSEYLDQSGSKTYATASGTDTYAVTLTPAITAYAAGQTFRVRFTNANTGAATINVNTLGAKSLVKDGSTALAAGDIKAGAIYTLTYDGTNFQVSTGGGASYSLLTQSTNTLSQSNATNAQTFNVYNTVDNVASPTNYERLSARFSSNVATISSEKGGTGANRNLELLSGLVGIRLSSGTSEVLLQHSAQNSSYTTTIQAAGSNNAYNGSIARVWGSTASGIPVNGFGSGLGIQLNDDGGNRQNAASYGSVWADVTAATRTSYLKQQRAARGGALIDVANQGVRKTVATNNTALSLFEITLPTLTGTGGTLRYTVYASDGTDVQTRSGQVRFSAVNKAGTYTSEIAVVSEGVSASAGTLAVTPSLLTGTNKITFQITPNTSLTTTTYYVVWSLENNSEQAITVL